MKPRHLQLAYLIECTVDIKMLKKEKNVNHIRFIISKEFSRDADEHQLEFKRISYYRNHCRPASDVWKRCHIGGDGDTVLSEIYFLY